MTLRPLDLRDWNAWREVRAHNQEWLVPWEPRQASGRVDPSTGRDAFGMRCAAKERERQLGTGYGFGIFLGPDADQFVGEINLNAVQRNAFQNAYVGYWIDERQAGNSYMPEALVVLANAAFAELGLHRLQIAIIPRNTASRRVVEKLDIRAEGVAQRYLQINGVWEDHIRYAITSEEWATRGSELMAKWVGTAEFVQRP